MRDRHANLLYRLRRTLQASAGTVADADLLDRYARGGDQAAFELILWRHAPMVWGVCRRVLGHTQDAEDAFQAAFLALARRAHTLHDGAALAAWLYRVAHRTALAAQANRRRRSELAHAAADLPGRTPPDPARTACDRELAALLDDEIARLPERVRLPFILCQLEGRDRAEAAAELQCPVGTVDSRLHRARHLLAVRLARRGVMLPAVGAVTVPAALRAATLQHIAAPVAGLPALLLAEKTLRALAVGTLKKCLAAALTVCLVVSGVGLAAFRPPAANPSSPPPPARPKPQRQADVEALPVPAEVVSRLGSPRLRHGGSIASVAFSPDGKWIASAAADGTARVWEAATGKLHLRVPLKGDGLRLFRVAFTAGSKSVVILDSASCRVLDVATGKERSTHPCPDGAALSDAAIAPDGKSFAVSQHAGNVQICDTISGERLQSLPVKGWSPLAFSSDGKALVALKPGAPGQPVDLEVFDTASGKRRGGATHDKPTLSALALGPRGNLVAALAHTTGPKESWRKEQVVLWNVATGKLLHRISGLELTSYCIALSPDGNLLSVGNLQRLWLQLFDVATGKEVRRLRCWPSVMTLAFSPDGKTLAAGKSEGTITLWDVATGKLRPASPDPDGGVGYLRFTGDGRSLLTVAGDITVRDWRTGQIVRRYLDPRKDLFTGLSVSPDGKMLAVGHWDKTVRLVDARTGKELHILKGHRLAAPTTLFAPDGRRLFTMGYDQTVRVWDVATGKQAHCLTIAGMSSNGRPAVSADGRVLAASHAVPDRQDEMHEIRLWDAIRGKELRRLEFAACAWGLALSPDGSKVACVGRQQDNGRLGDLAGVVLLWDVASGRQLHSFSGHSAAVHGVTFSPDGRMLATGGGDHTVRLWEVASGKERHRFTGHESPVGPVAFSPDGRFLATASYDTPIFVWDVSGTAGHRPVALRAGEEDRLWNALADPDAATAFKAMRRLLAHPAAAVAFLRARLKPAMALDETRLKQLLRDLDDDSFDTRAQATAALKDLAEQIESRLRKEKERPCSLEKRRRLDEILAGVKTPSPGRLREMRAIETLELLGTPEAVGVLARLSTRGTGGRLTDEAAAARRRLHRRTGD